MTQYTEKRTITFTEAIYERLPCTQPSTGTYSVKVGERQVTAEVQVVIDLDAVFKTLGRAACGNKTGKSSDGHVTVKRTGAVRETARTMYPKTESLAVDLFRKEDNSL